jgi:DNA repair exonuclease SbcCD ATPase subunit
MRKQRIDKIEARIDRLNDTAAELLEREQATAIKLEDYRRSEPTGRLSATRHRRALTKAEAKLERLKTERAQLIERELNGIMVELELQARRTRERLDEELERLVPVQEEWERLRGTFSTLEHAVATPAIEKLAGQWSSGLQIPEFPVQEREGYARPFPAGALLF